MNLARARLLTGDPKGALAVMDQFLASNARNVMALQLATAIALQGHDIEKAAGYVERLRQAAPDSPATDRYEGDLAMAQKRYKDALASYRKAGEKGQDRGLVLAQYAAARLAGDPSALKVVEDWVAAHPGDSRAVIVVAESRHAAGNRDSAISLYEQGIAASPKDVVMLNNLAVLYQEKGDPRAADVGQRAYNLAPNSPQVADTYGWILFDTGRLDESIRLLDAASRAAPNAGEIQYHYGAALAKAGRKEEAVGPLRKALAGELPPAVRTDAQKLLRQLSK
jgi:tetratricopeptide (TPR) repeat protein